MTKYNIIELKLKDGKILNIDTLSQNQINALTCSNAIYIYSSSKTHKVYIGQTINFRKRNEQHYSGLEEKFNKAGFDKVLVIVSVYFNGTALDDVENQLITYFSVDYKYKKSHKIGFDENTVINLNGGNSVNSYAEREKVATEVILPLWEKELYPRKLVNTPTLEKLRSDALVKYSPIKVLTNEQSEIIDEILDNPDKNYIINGDAGTGKTVLLTHLVAKYLNERSNIRIGVVVQPNWEDTGNKIFKVYGMGVENLTIATSTKIISSGEKYDVIIVDESHKLSRKGGKQQDAFNKVYRDNPEYSDCMSHLEILQRMGNQIILMYDVLQGIRPANITREMFRELTSSYEIKYLSTQFRIQPAVNKNYTSDDYINGIKYLPYKDTGLLESGFTKFNPNFNRDVFRDKTSDAYFGYYSDLENTLHDLKDWVESDRNYNPEHINRLLAGMVERWTHKEGKDINKKQWNERDIHLRWNSKQENWVNIDDEDAEDQIGSVFAVQGIDLNKVGVIIGKDLQIGADGKLFGSAKDFCNVNGKFSIAEMKKPKYAYEFTLFILNMYYVLLTRGIDGIRIGFWKNDEFRKYMEKTLEIV